MTSDIFYIKYGGEVENRMNRYGYYVTIGIIILFNLLPLIISIIISWTTPTNFYLVTSIIIWYTWLIYAIIKTGKNVDRKVVFLWLFLYLPLILPTVLSIRFLVWMLKQKYPNSDDPEYLKKWNRHKKIKTII